MKRNLLTNLEEPRPADAKVGANRSGWMRILMGVVFLGLFYSGCIGANIIPKLYLPTRNTPSGDAGWTIVSAPINNATTDYWKMILDQASSMESPAMDFSAYTSINIALELQSFGTIVSHSDDVKVEYWNGSTWVQVGSNLHTSSTAGIQNISLPYSYAAAKIRITAPNETAGAGARIISVEITGTSVSSCTIALTSAAGTDSQTIISGNPITNITYATSVATGATVTGLPTGVSGSWASNVFTISGTPTVTGTFNYTVTLTGGGCSNTANGTITVNAAGGGGCATDLIISEYIEGSSNNKAIEIYNGTGAVIDLSNYTIYMYANGSATPSNTLALSGTLADGDVYVIANAGANATILALADITASVALYNGDDAIAIWNETTSSYSDIFGNIGSDPGTAWISGTFTTEDKTLVRNTDVLNGITTNPAVGFPTLATEWTQYNIDIVTNLGSHTMSCGPVLTVTPASITGFTYAFGSGPSASQSYSLSGSSLTGFPGNITVTAPTDYEVSLDNSSFSASLNVAYTTATLGATTIYVRLKIGLAAGTYNGQVIENAGGGASAPAEVICSGNVTGPTITVSSTFLNGFNYLVGAGPSSSQTYTVSGSLLSPAAGNISLTAPTDFEISTDGINYFASLLLPYTLSTLNATTIYVRLKTGLAIGSYNNETLSHSGGTAATVNTTLSGFVSDPAALPTVLEKGDFAILAVNNYADGVVGSSADEISFVCFKDLNPGTTIYFTDNGYERVTAGLWGNTEGVVSMTRINAVLPKGTIISIHSVNGGINDPADFTVYTCGAADANWTKGVVSPASYFFDLNKDDQVWFMQGGTWANLGTALHDATYTGGNVLYGWTDIDWKTAPGYASTKGSTIYPGCNCFVTDVNNPVSGASQVKFDDPAAVDFSSATNARLDWIAMINEPANWDYYTADADYDAGGYNYLGSATCPAMTIAVNTYVDGKWTGNKNTNWFECENWNTFVIPNEATNVLIPSGAILNEPTIGDPPTFPVVYTGAECNDIDIQTGRTLTMNHTNSVLDVYNNWAQEGTLNFNDGIVNFIDGNSTISGSGAKAFYNLKLNKTANSNTLTLSGNDISVSNVLTLTKGILTTGTSRVIVTNTATTAITGHVIPGSVVFTGYINGNLRRNVAATGSYDFPVGTAAQYEYSNINLTASAGLTFIDAFFVAPHTTPIDITSLGLMVGTSQINELLDYGFWTITPDAGTYTYDVTLTERLHTNPGSTADAHTVVKRPNAASNWVLQGTHLNTTQSMGTTPANWVTAKRSALTIFSDFAIAKSNSGTLPVELIKFDAYLSNGTGILEWSTASETNCSHYIIERSVNDMLHFEPIGTVAGNGNSNIMNSYALKDSEVQPGINYYRLVQYDFDGSRNEIGIRYIVLTADNEPISIANISNSGNAVSADIINIQGGYFEVQVLDATGKLVYSAISESGDDAYRVVVDNLPAQGIYMLRVSDGFSSDVKKFVVF